MTLPVNRNLLDTGDHILLGLSGGPDSLTLAHWLLVLAYLLPWATACALWQHHKHRQHRIAHPVHPG